MELWRRSRGIFLLVLLIVVVPGLLRQPGAAARLCGADHEAIDGEEAELLRIINSYRADNGAHPLSISPILTAAAAWMAEDLATHSYFSHTDSLGRSPYQRAVDCGYGTGAGENLAAGTSWSSASAAFAAWRASPGHNANMLGAFYREIGIARYYRDGSPYGWYWVTTFGTGSQQQPTPAPTPTRQHHLLRQLHRPLCHRSLRPRPPLLCRLLRPLRSLRRPPIHPSSRPRRP